MPRRKRQRGNAQSALRHEQAACRALMRQKETLIDALVAILPLLGRTEAARHLIRSMHAVGYVHCGDWLDVP
jgi:hypothetical protein